MNIEERTATKRCDSATKTYVFHVEDKAAKVLSPLPPTRYMLAAMAGPSAWLPLQVEGRLSAGSVLPELC